MCIRDSLQLKTELCIQAEALQESTEWKATSDALIKLQKEWKEIGPVPRKQSERCWKRFRKVRNERDKFFTKIKQLESDIVLWENNIGFFAKSTNADTMIREVEEKIESAKKLIKTLEEKVKMIDQSGLDD